MTTLPLIANPSAGGGRCGERVASAVAQLEARGLAIAVHRTERPGHATELAARLRAEGHDTLLVAGGDGTTYEVVNGLFPALPDRPRPTLGLLPLGTGNSFLRDVDIVTESRAIDAVADGRTRPADVIRATTDDGVIHYLNLLSIGFTSEVGATTNRWFKRLGAGGYAVATVLEVARLRSRSFPCAIDDGPLDARPAVFLSFNNSRCTGGEMRMAPDADIADGRLDVIRAGDLSRAELLATFPKIYEGTHTAHPKVEATTAATVRFELDGPLALMIDGEVVHARLERLEVLPQALEILA